MHLVLTVQEFPQRRITASDALDDEYEYDNEIEPPYPSSHFDRYLVEQRRRQMARERREEMAEWSSGISSDI
jgi:hypothetical protein